MQIHLADLSIIILIIMLDYNIFALVLVTYFGLYMTEDRKQKPNLILEYHFPHNYRVSIDDPALLFRHFKKHEVSIQEFSWLHECWFNIPDLFNFQSVQQGLR